MQALETQIEELEKKRDRWLAINLIGFIVWDGFRIMDNYLIEGGVNNTLEFIYFLGWITWIIGLIQMFRLGYSVKKTHLASQVLNDEWVEFIRLKSWRLAFIMIVLIQIVIIGLQIFTVSVSGILSAELTLFVAVVSAIAAFIYYNKVADGRI